MARFASRAVLGLLVLLSAPAVLAQSAVDSATDYLRQNAAAVGLAPADLADLVVADQNVSRVSGITHIYYQQAIDGIPVYDAIVNVAVGRTGAVLAAGSRAVPNLRRAVRSDARGLGAAEAVQAAGRALGIPVSLSGSSEPLTGLGEGVAFTDAVSGESVQARLMYVPVFRGGVELAWVVTISSTDGAHLWQAAVHAGSGAIIHQDDLANEEQWAADDHLPAGWAVVAPTAPAASPSTLMDLARLTDSAPVGATPGAVSMYRVYGGNIESPSHAGNATQDFRTRIFTAGNPEASPLGWHNTGAASYTITRGNNVHAGVDLVSPNGIDEGTEPDGTSRLWFNFPFSPSTQPAAEYRPAAVTNTFFWNNVVHDVTWFYGFDEEAGNFQTVNFSGLSDGNDAVRAESQDYSGTNNANFSTPPDGFAPRMQMYVWTNPLPNELAYNGQTVEMTGAAFGPKFPLSGLAAAGVLVTDGTALPNEGCNPLVNGAEVAGKVAVVYRGSCAFTIKVKNAQDAGAVGVVVVNNAGGNPGTLGGADATVTIPAGMVSDVNGAALIGALPTTVTVRNLGAAVLDRDSDFDNGIIVHEYGHGISNRLTGGRLTTSCLATTYSGGGMTFESEQMGEGWSDYYALLLTDTNTDGRGIGTYAVYQPTDGQGIRPYRYSTDMSVNPMTYDYIKTAVAPHGVGTVWATMAWDMTRNLVGRYGFDPDIYTGTGGNNLALQLVTEGLKLQPCRPGFVDGRDAILAADVAINDGANQCLIWDSFARRGLGASADQGWYYDKTDGTEAFDLPLSCATSSMGVDAVNALVASTALTAGQGEQLVSKLTSAQQALAASRPRPDIALNRVNAFIASVQTIGVQRLTDEEEQRLVDIGAGYINRIHEFYPGTTALVAFGGTASASAGLPTEFALDQNAPNPIGAGAATIQFALPEDAQVRLVVYDVMGRAVAEVANGAFPAGFHRVSVDTGALASGTYVYRIEAGDFTATRQMTVVR